MCILNRLNVSESNLFQPRFFFNMKRFCRAIPTENSLNLLLNVTFYPLNTWSDINIESARSNLKKKKNLTK